MIMKLEDNGIVSALEGNKRRVLVNLNGSNDKGVNQGDNVDDLF